VLLACLSVCLDVTDATLFLQFLDVLLRLVALRVLSMNDGEAFYEMSEKGICIDEMA